MKVSPLAVCLSVLSFAASAETIDLQLVATGNENSFFVPLSGDIQVYRTEAIYDQIEQRPNDRLEIASLHCFGSFRVLTGLATGGGHCTLEDVQGDQILQEWTIDKVALGQAFGTWHFVAGTGKHQDVSGRGAWANETVARTGAIRNTISGIVTWSE